MKLIECPYCHKKVYATRWQLMVRGRLSLLCPACHRFLFHAVRKRLLLMQTVMIFVAVLLCAGLAQMNIPGGFPGQMLALAAGIAAGDGAVGADGQLGVPPVVFAAGDGPVRRKGEGRGGGAQGGGTGREE